MNSGKVMSIAGMLAVLAGSGVLSRAEACAASDKTSVASRSERRVQVTAGKVVSLVVGKGAAAQMHIAAPTKDSHPDEESIVHVDDIALVVSGPGAQACMTLPMPGSPVPCTHVDTPLGK